MNDELVSLMGGNVADIEYSAPGQGPTVVLLAGLQGVGKTTACGKLALFFKKRVRTILLLMLMRMLVLMRGKGASDRAPGAHPERTTALNACLVLMVPESRYSRHYPLEEVVVDSLRGLHTALMLWVGLRPCWGGVVRGRQNKSCMLVATDIYRPAAIDQLHTLGRQVDVPVFSAGTDVAPPEIAKRGVAEAKKQNTEVVIIDTAGRLQVGLSSPELQP